MLFNTTFTTLALLCLKALCSAQPEGDDSRTSSLMSKARPCRCGPAPVNKDYLEEVIAANEVYAENYEAQPNIAPSDHVAIVTCMDARIDPLQITGIKETGKAHIIRNAGGRVNEDVIRSLIISEKLLGTNQWFVIHHTDCGMQKFDQCVMDDLLKGSLVTATLTKNCNQNLYPVEPNCACHWKNEVKCGSWDNKDIDWQAITKGLERSVYDDVVKIRNHPGVPPYIPIYGFIFDVISGKLIPVPKANKAGRACCN